jgi:hypothetical protein
MHYNAGPVKTAALERTAQKVLAQHDGRLNRTNAQDLKRRTDVQRKPKQVKSEKIGA